MLVSFHPSLTGASIESLSGGADLGIALDPLTGLNRYPGAPHPCGVPQFVSSMANGPGAEARKHPFRTFPDEGEGGNLAIMQVWEQIDPSRVQERKTIAA
jgi:hypothetical protein